MKLPIEVSCDRPLRFRWRGEVNGRQVECEGALPVGVERAVADLVAEAERLLEESTKLAAFKAWVHAYLDGKGVPKEIDGPHSAEGCRIGDRMDWVFDQLAAAHAKVAEAPRPAATAPPKGGRR